MLYAKQLNRILILFWHEKWAIYIDLAWFRKSSTSLGHGVRYPIFHKTQYIIRLVSINQWYAYIWQKETRFYNTNAIILFSIPVVKLICHHHTQDSILQATHIHLNILWFWKTDWFYKCYDIGIYVQIWSSTGQYTFAVDSFEKFVL